MKKSIFLFIFSIILLEIQIYAVTFKIGGLFGLSETYKNAYKNAPVGYIEHKFYSAEGWDVRGSLGFSYVENSLVEQSVLYGYSDTTYKITGLKTTLDSYPVYGPLNGEHSIFIVPAAIQVFKYFKFSPKSPEFSAFGGVSALYYSEDYKQFTDSNDVFSNAKIDSSKSGLLFGINIGIGARLSKSVFFNGQYNILGSTKLHTNLNNAELTLKFEY